MEFFYSKTVDADTVVLSPEESRHCIKVLRHKKGDEVMVSTGDAHLYRCVIEEDSASGAVLRIAETLPGVGGHAYFLEMAVAPTKNMDRYEWFMEKATEMGVDVIVPLCCDHSERKVFKRERGERILVSAVKQSLKTEMPRLRELTPFRDYIRESSAFEGRKFIAFCDAEVFGSDGLIRRRVELKEAVALSRQDGGSSRALCLIGPEGDFSKEEVLLAIDNGFIPLSLGSSRLRTETAATLCVAAYYLSNQ